MATVHREALVSHTAPRMFGLVQDVAAYPEFLPWCESTKIFSQDDVQMRASISLAHSGIRKTFTTQNRYQTDKIIEIKLIDGPFSHLEGFWQFKPLGDEGCKVIFDLEFEFSNRLIKMALGSIFNQIASTMVESFCRRADEVYGNE